MIHGLVDEDFAGYGVHLIDSGTGVSVDRTVHQNGTAAGVDIVPGANGGSPVQLSILCVDRRSVIYYAVVLIVLTQMRPGRVKVDKRTVGRSLFQRNGQRSVLVGSGVMLHLLTNVTGAGCGVGIAATGSQAVGAVLLHNALAVQIIGQEYCGLCRGRLDRQLDGVALLDMNGVGQFNTAGICMADLHQNILVIKLRIQRRFCICQCIIAHAVDLGIVPAAAGGICTAVWIGSGDIERGGLPVHPHIVVRLIPVKAGRPAAGGHKRQCLLLGSHGKAGQVQLPEQPDSVVLIIRCTILFLGNADRHRLTVTGLGHRVCQILGKPCRADRVGNRHRLCKAVSLRYGTLHLIHGRHGSVRRGLHGDGTVAVGHRVVIGMLCCRERLIGSIGNSAGGICAVIERQIGQPVCGDRLRNRHVQPVGGREGDLGMIPGILRGNAGIALSGNQVIGAIHRRNFRTRAVEHLHRRSGGNAQRHRHGGYLLNVKRVAVLFPIGSRDLDRVVQTIPAQRHSSVSGDSVALIKRIGGNVQRRGNGRQTVLPRSRFKIQGKLRPFRRDSQRFQGWYTGHGNGIGLNLGIAVRAGVLSLQRKCPIFHAGGKQVCKRCGRTVPAAGHVRHVLAVGAGIDGAELGGIGTRDIPYYRIQVYTAQSAGSILDPILRRVVCPILYSSVRLLIGIQKPDIAEPLAVGQGHRDLSIGGNRQRSVRAVISAVGNAEFVVARNDLGAAGAGGDVAVGICQGDDRFRQGTSVLRGRRGNGILSPVQERSVFRNGILQILQERPRRVGICSPQPLQRRGIGTRCRRIILHMVGHVQIICHLEDQLDGRVRIRRRHMDADGLDGGGLCIQLVAALVVVEHIVGRDAVDLINEALLQANEFNVRSGQRFLNGLAGLIVDSGWFHDGTVGVHGNEHEAAALSLRGHCRDGNDGSGQKYQAKQQRHYSFAHFSFSSLFSVQAVPQPIPYFLPNRPAALAGIQHTHGIRVHVLALLRSHFLGAEQRLLVQFRSLRSALRGIGRTVAQ